MNPLSTLEPNASVHPSPSVPSQPALPKEAASKRSSSLQKTSEKGVADESHRQHELDQSLFASLIAPPGGAQTFMADGEAEFGSLYQTRFFNPPSSSLLGDVWGSTSADLLSKIPTSPDDFKCSLFLPQLGQVDVEARFSQDHCFMNFQFINRRALELAQANKRELNNKLQQRFNRKVTLALSGKGEGHDA